MELVQCFQGLEVIFDFPHFLCIFGSSIILTYDYGFTTYAGRYLYWICDPPLSGNNQDKRKADYLGNLFIVVSYGDIRWFEQNDHPKFK